MLGTNPVILRTKPVIFKTHPYLRPIHTKKPVLLWVKFRTNPTISWTHLVICRANPLIIRTNQSYF